mgnify:FL=1
MSNRINDRHSKNCVDPNGFNTRIVELEIMDKVAKETRREQALRRRKGPKRKGKPYDPADKYKGPTP